MNTQSLCLLRVLCALLLEEIEHGQYECNQKFKEKYTYLFDYQRNRMNRESKGLFDDENIIVFSYAYIRLNRHRDCA